MTEQQARGAPGLSPAEAGRHVERAGFMVVNGTAPEARGGANLVVALRERPTLEHFDPERIEHWISAAGRGRTAEISRRTTVPFEHPFSWGTIRVLDRVEAFNSFLTFGGTLRGWVQDAGTILVVFSSHAPIVRSTGHSQSVDLSTGEIGAFFARMMIPIDYTPGAEQRIAEASPTALYAAFQASAWARMRAAGELAASHPQFAAWCRRERERLVGTFPADWDAGGVLARDLELDRA